LAGSAGFFSGADGQPIKVNDTVTKKIIETIIAKSLFIDFYLPLKIFFLTLVNQ
jgi:hypothetical protein